jgi:hypothetical protein
MPLPKVDGTLMGSSLYSSLHEYGTSARNGKYIVHKDFKEVTLHGVTILVRNVHDGDPYPQGHDELEFVNWLFPIMTNKEAHDLVNQFIGHEVDMTLVGDMARTLCRMRMIPPTRFERILSEDIL